MDPKRSKYSVADDISKLVDYDDYMINDAVVIALDDLWGLHTYDGFATMPKSSALFMVLQAWFECR